MTRPSAEHWVYHLWGRQIVCRHITAQARCVGKRYFTPQLPQLSNTIATIKRCSFWQPQDDAVPEARTSTQIQEFFISSTLNDNRARPALAATRHEQSGQRKLNKAAPHDLTSLFFFH